MALQTQMRLAAKAQHQMALPGVLEKGHGLVVERRGEVDAVDLGANRFAERDGAELLCCGVGHVVWLAGSEIPMLGNTAY